MANTRKQQILQSIRQALASGYWRVGQRMPTERQLADEFACAVGTIRGVLSILEADGLVTRVQGSGTLSNGHQRVPNIPSFIWSSTPVVGLPQHQSLPPRP